MIQKLNPKTITKAQSAALAKISTGPWNLEYTPELGIAFHLSLENYEYDEALRAVGVLLKQPDRRRAIDPGEITGQIQVERRRSNPARQYWTAKDHEPPESSMTQEQKEAQCADMRAKYPDLFKAMDRRSSKLKRGFDEGCSD